MEKFSDIDVNLTGTAQNAKVLHDGYLKVVENEGWEYVRERDCVIVLPYIKETNEVLLRIEPVPPYKERDGFDYFVTAVSGTMEEGESPEDTIRRELEEECGLRLPEGKRLEVLRPLFMNKGNTAKYHVCVLPLSESEIIWIDPSGDGSDAEAKSSTIKVKRPTLASISVADLITSYVLTLL